jgi:tRNA(fMet)-specific endonuclease VapC
MKQLLIDTNIYSKGMSGNDYAANLLRVSEEILLSPIVVGELLFGFKQGSREKENLEIFRKFQLSPRVTIIDITIETSEFYSLIVRDLRKKGTPIPTNDIWIAASVMEYGAHLATMDKHFKFVEGILSIHE